MKTERNPEKLAILQNNPFYKEWDSWVSVRLAAAGLEVKTSHDPINNVFRFKVVNPKNILP